MIRKIPSKILTSVLCCAFFCTGLTACGEKKQDAVKPSGLVADSEVTYSVSKDSDILSEFQEYSEMILSLGNAEFFGRHPVDEGFLSHITSLYGINVLRDIVAENNYSNPEIWFERTGKSIHVLWDEYQSSSWMRGNSGDNIREIQPVSTEETVLDFTGDLNLADGVATTVFLDQTGGTLKNCFSEQLMNEMTGADLFSINNEFCYSNGGAALEGKDYTFRAKPERAELLSELGVDFVNLANNHVYDYGGQALLDTLDSLNAAGLPYLGAGKNLQEAKKPLYYIANGRKIAIVSATQIERSLDYTKEATEDSPGVLKTLNPSKYVKVIREATKSADVVIALVHWGTEGNTSYGEDQVKLAEAFAEAGADAIIGCHSHCLQGIENMNGVPVYYSLGNYWFATDGHMPNPYDTGLAQIRIQKDGSIKAYFLPCRFDSGITSLVTDAEEKENKISYMQSLSNSVSLSEDGEITAR